MNDGVSPFTMGDALMCDMWKDKSDIQISTCVISKQTKLP